LAKQAVKPNFDINDKYVKQWLEGLSERTKANYVKGFEKWVSFVEMSPSQQIAKRMKDLTSQDLTERTYFEAKFRAYKEMRENAKTERPLSPLTIKSELRTIASFFGRTVGKLSLRRGDWNSTLSTRIQNKLSIGLKDVKAMYAHANLRDRVLLLALAQSGFSEVDVSEFRIEDLKGIYEQPLTLHYFLEKPREKTGEIQATCLSFECVHDLRDLLSEKSNPKEGYLFTSTTNKAQNDPIETRAIHEAMQNLAKKALGENVEFKTKMLRSFYNSALLRADIKSEVKDLLMGHQRLGSRGHYGYDSETIKEAYAKAFEFLSINGLQSKEDIAKLKENLNNLIGSQQVQIEAQKEENKQLKDRMSRLEDVIREKTQIDPQTIKKMILEGLQEIERAKPEKVNLS
jgi:hypothetical protein